MIGLPRFHTSMIETVTDRLNFSERTNLVEDQAADAVPPRKANDLGTQLPRKFWHRQTIIHVQGNPLTISRDRGQTGDTIAVSLYLASLEAFLTPSLPQ